MIRHTPELAHLVCAWCGKGWHDEWDAITRTLRELPGSPVLAWHSTPQQRCLAAETVDFATRDLERLAEAVAEIESRGPRRVWRIEMEAAASEGACRR